MTVKFTSNCLFSTLLVLFFSFQLTTTHAQCDPPNDPSASCSSFLLYNNNMTVNANANFCIEVKTRNFNSITSIDATMTWDHTVLQFSHVTIGALPNGNTDDGVNFGYSNTSTGTLPFNWIDAIESHTLADDVTLFSVCFTVISSSPNTSGNFAYSGLSAGQEDTSFGEDEPIVAYAGTVMTSGSMTNDCDPATHPDNTCSGLTIYTENWEVNEGQTFCVNVRTRNFSQLAYVQWTMEWDRSVIGYNRLDFTNSELPGLTIDAFGEPDLSDSDTSDDDKLGFLWFSENGEQISLPDDALLFSVCYDAVSSTPYANGDITFTNSVVNIEAGSESGTSDTPLSFYPGLVETGTPNTLNNPGGGDGPNPSNPSQTNCGNYQAAQNINSNISTTTNCKVVFKAGNVVTLTAGFMVPVGGEFCAFGGADLNSFNEEEDNSFRQVTIPTTVQENINYGLQCAPNPVHNGATIEYKLDKAQRILLHLVNAQGELVQTISNTFQSEGLHRIALDTKNLPQGLYWLRLQSNDKQEVKTISVY